MKWLRSIAKEPAQPELGNVESILEDVFEPVLPRQEYVKDLNRRLARIPDSPELEVDRGLPRVSGRAQVSILWSFFGMLSGIFLVVIGIRVIVILVSSLRAIYQKQI